MLPAVITLTVVFTIPFFDVTDDTERTGIISVSLFRTPVAKADAPNVNTAAVTFPPDRPARDHSIRSGNTETFAFFPATCDVNDNNGSTTNLLIDEPPA